MSVRCGLGWVPNAEYAGFWVADEAGLYREQAVDVEFIPGGPGRPGAIESLLAGAVELTITSDLPSLLAARAAGHDLRVLGAVMPRSPLGMAALASSGIAGSADLSGRVLGAGTAHDRVLLDALFAANGLEPDYQLRTVDSGFDALAAGEVEALSCSTINQVPAAREAGLDVLAWTFAELGLAMPGDLVVARGEWLASEPVSARRFLTASREGWRKQLEDPAAGARLTWERFGSSWSLDLDQCLRESALQADLMRPAPELLAIDANELASCARLLAGAMGIAAAPVSELLAEPDARLAAVQERA